MSINKFPLAVVFGGVLLAGAAAAPLTLSLAGPAYAQASAKAVVDAAKARGEVGEKADGYLGVRGAASAPVRAAVQEINAGRREVYQQAATSTGVTLEAAAAAAAVHLLAQVPAGQFYQNAAGAWVRK